MLDFVNAKSMILAKLLLSHLDCGQCFSFLVDGLQQPLSAQYKQGLNEVTGMENAGNCSIIQQKILNSELSFSETGMQSPINEQIFEIWLAIYGTSSLILVCFLKPTFK